MNKYIIFVLALLTTEICNAQFAYFGNRGTIAFDKITYTRARMRDVMKQFEGQTPGRGGGGGRGMFGGGDINSMPESSTEKMLMYFDEEQSLLQIDPASASSSEQARGGQMRISSGNAGAGRGGNRQGGNNNAAGMMRGAMRNQNSGKALYQNIKKQTAEIQVEIDDKYILSDSLSEITWRFTDEYRTIAGFECRRVNGATKDSLYLIAYYTDQIPVSAGPALSHGLPGMILGLVIPEMHIHYWATKVDYSNERIAGTEWKDKKSKNMSLDEFSNAFGRYFQRFGNNSSDKRRVLEQLIY